MKYKNITNLEQFKQDYLDFTMIQMRDKYKLNHKTIWSYAKKLGVVRKVGEKKLFKVNDSYFSKAISFCKSIIISANPLRIRGV